jgi:radical SAM superfamily enzyme YgiQ (UPF0313 family)
LRVALVNPNRYLEPPVIPLGIEYLAHYLDREGHRVEVIDLAFSPHPHRDLREAVASFEPQVIGFSLRNIDTCLYHDNQFFLDEAAELITTCREISGAKVVIGGTALLAGPREVAEYLSCDHAVYGPGERAFPRLLGYLSQGISPPRLVDGWESSYDREEVPERGRFVDYTPYLKERGVVGFATQSGCRGDCDFCLEAALPWRARHPRAVVEELKGLSRDGCAEFHLCDCEFNQDLDTAKTLLKEMAAAALGVNWSLYMKPLPHDRALFRLLQESGAGSVTLSVDSHSLRRGAYSPSDLRSFVELAHERGMRVAVDLLAGFPDEGIDEVLSVLDLLRGVRPDTAFGRSLRARPPAKGSVEGDDPDCIKPVFYNWLSTGDCRALIGGDPLFRIEGLERRSNYERLQ